MFYYSLAEHLGYASVNRMLSEMSSREVTQWKLYFKIRKKHHEEEAEEEKLRIQAEQNRRRAG